MTPEERCQHGSHPMGCVWCSMLGPQHPLHDEVRRLTAERDEAEATIATLRGEVEQAKLEATGAYNLFPPLLQAIDVAINGPTTNVMRGYTTLPQQVEALKAENATLREQLQAAQELLELPETCVVCSAILEPREEEAPHCYDCVVTDEHEAERQDRITQLEIALAQAAQAHPTPAQEGE